MDRLLWTLEVKIQNGCSFKQWHRSVPVRSGGNYRNGEREGGVLFAISGTGTVRSVLYAVPDGSECSKLPKMATILAFRASETARPSQTRNFRNWN